MLTDLVFSFENPWGIFRFLPMFRHLGIGGCTHRPICTTGAKHKGFCRCTLLNIEVGIRKLPADRFDRGRQNNAEDRVDAGDADRDPFAVAELVETVLEFPHSPQDMLGPGQKKTAGLGQRQFPRPAVEQLGADGRFQL